MVGGIVDNGESLSTEQNVWTMLTMNGLRNIGPATGMCIRNQIYFNSG